MSTLKNAIALAIVSAFAVPAQAQSIDQALQLYRGQKLEEAALAFYDVLQNDADPDRRDQAEIYLAETLRKVGLLVPALFYYTDLFKAGRTNRYYLNAVDGLLQVQKELHDPLWVPSLINENLDPEGFAQLDPEKIAQINFLVGELSFRQRKNQDARAFLEYVPPESPLHTRARYLLGVLSIRSNDPEGAMQHFKAILDIISAEETNSELKHIRNMALLAVARTAYGMGRFDEATESFRKVPRFSEEWFEAMYENAWAFFRKEEYGKALGELQSITAPYFSKRHMPEAYVIRGTTYFVNCQWDRVRNQVARFKKTYNPMATALTAYLGESREAGDYYRDVVEGGKDRFDIELAREVRRAQRFKDYHYMLTHMGWERERIDATRVWKGGRLGDDLAMIIEQHREGTEQVAGKWAKIRLMELAAAITNFQAQINILDFEVSDAERAWLEQGKEVLKGRRARLPRPDIPDDQWQHWSFKKEYWKDEIGFIQHTLRTECN